MIGIAYHTIIPPGIISANYPRILFARGDYRILRAMIYNTVSKRFELHPSYCAIINTLIQFQSLGNSLYLASDGFYYFTPSFTDEPRVEPLQCAQAGETVQFRYL